MTNDDIKVVTYHSVNSKPDEQWLGYIVLPDGNRWLVSFSGSEEASVIAKAQSFYRKEKERLDNLYGKSDIEVDKSANHVKGSGRGAHFAGKVWVVNRQLHDLKRIPESELADYEARGYVRGGPRSVK